MSRANALQFFHGSWSIVIVMPITVSGDEFSDIEGQICRFKACLARIVDKHVDSMF